MGFAAVRVLLLVAVTLPATSAEADPCNFQTRQVFPHEQVLACYESVPFHHEDLEEAIEVVSAWRERSDLPGLRSTRSTQTAPNFQGWVR